MFDEFIFRKQYEQEAYRRATLAAAADRYFAERGECPTARQCKSLYELAAWFTNAGIAAGVIGTPRDV